MVGILVNQGGLCFIFLKFWEKIEHFKQIQIGFKQLNRLWRWAQSIGNLTCCLFEGLYRVHQECNGLMSGFIETIERNHLR